MFIPSILIHHVLTTWEHDTGTALANRGLEPAVRKEEGKLFGPRQDVDVWAEGEA
jgi:hypothetical protein